MERLEKSLELKAFMDSIELSVSKLEQEIEVSRGTLKWNDGFPEKHFDKVVEYLTNTCGYSEEAMEEILVENKPRKRVLWNENRPFDFADDSYRYQDDVGLWRIIDIDIDSLVSDEVYNDWRGEYLLYKDGTKAYFGMAVTVKKDIRLKRYITGRKPNFYYNKKDYRKALSL